jgi:TPR repeat protein
VRLAPLLGGAALCLAAAAVSLIWLRGGDGPRTDRPAPSATSAPSSAPSFAPPSAPGSAVPTRAAARDLSFRVLALANSEEVLAGVAALTKSAEQGDVEAQIGLGRIYLKGHPAVPKDPKRAREWLLLAAPSRHPSAAYFLGVISQSGQGVKADPAEAARWFDIAAQGGSPDAMFLLANAYRIGAGVPRDEAKAIELYEKAGKMEHPAALQALAMAYQYGELGLKPDEAEQRRYMMEAEHALHHPSAPP